VDGDDGGAAGALTEGGPMPMRWRGGAAALALLAGLLLWWTLTNRPDEPDVAGRVLDGGRPVEGAAVRLQGTGLVSVTDRRGFFRLPFRPGARLTASAPGRLIAGAPFDAPFLTLRLRPLPEADHEEYQWVDPAPDPERPQNCANCHAALYREWSASGHARSASGRHFRGLYEGADWDGRGGVGWGLLAQHPDGAGVCSSCHAPAVRDDDPGALDLRRLSGTALQGVHCDYCHKVQQVGDGVLGLSHGRFNLRLLRPGPGEQLFFGPLDDVDRGEDSFSPLYRDSRYCASCHEGVVFGVPVYTTYSEWLDSPARRQGLQCQNCHMAPTGRLTNFAPGRGGLERDPATLANHRFFDGGRDAMLRRCLSCDAELRRGPGGVEAEVRLRVEGAGHRVPTGYIDRQLILVAEAVDAGGRELAAEEGPTLPAAVGKPLAGRQGRLFARVLRDESGHSPAPFWRTDGAEPTDTRLTPGATERVRWRFPTGMSRLRLRVLYRRFWDEVARSKGWPDRDLTVFDQSVEAP
jgi:hypothetical protein